MKILPSGHDLTLNVTKFQVQFADDGDQDGVFEPEVIVVLVLLVWFLITRASQPVENWDQHVLVQFCELSTFRIAAKWSFEYKISF